MMSDRKALIVIENSFIPLDIRVWYEATSLRDAGWQVVVICPEPNRNSTTDVTALNAKIPKDLEGIKVYYYPLISAEHGVFDYFHEYLSAFISIVKLSRHVWREDRFDVFQLCNPPDIFFPIAFVFRFLGVKIIFDHHDLFPEFVLARYHGLIGRILYLASRVTEYLTMHTANVVISNNQSYRQIAMDRGNIPKDRVVIVRNGPKTSDFVPVEPLLSLKRGFQYMACYAGVMGQLDGVIELLRSVRYIVHDVGRKDIIFILLGDGSIRRHAFDCLQTWQIEPFVSMPGRINDKFILRQYLCTADVLLSPEPMNPLNAHSTFIKVGEYMAMGKPIVAYDLIETRFTAQKSALYVKPGDHEEYGRAILTLVDDQDLRNRMGSYGQKRIENQLSWEHQQQNLFQAYNLALGEE